MRVGEPLGIPYNRPTIVGIKVGYLVTKQDGSTSWYSTVVNVSSNVDAEDVVQQVRQMVSDDTLPTPYGSNQGVKNVYAEISATLTGGYERGIALVLPELAQPG
jgi:hypothetical protein